MIGQANIHQFIRKQWLFCSMKKNYLFIVCLAGNECHNTLVVTGKMQLSDICCAKFVIRKKSTSGQKFLPYASPKNLLRSCTKIRAIENHKDLQTELGVAKM